MMDGYNKICKCIQSIEDSSQNQCVANLINNWLTMVDKWCDEVYHDKTNRHRKKDTNKLGDLCAEMFEQLKNMCEQKSEEFEDDDYIAVSPAVHIKSLQEIDY